MSLDPSTGAGGSAPVPPEVRAAPPEARLDDYVRVARLGAGAMGEVWRAWDLRLGRFVALKLLRGGHGDAERLLREARLAGKLAHPGIATIYGVGTAAGQPYIAMQLVEGRTLRERLDTAGDATPLDRRAIVRLVRDAARAVHHAHTQGIVHRDVKPENLMVTGDGDAARVTVLDFGLARATGADASISVGGTVVGTPSYMPPEQARGAGLDPRADVWALGATCYDALAGVPPFAGDSAYEVFSRVLREEARSLRRLDPRVPPDLETVVMSCLERDPARRYASAAALADDFDRWLAGEAIAAHPPARGYRLRKWLARRKAVAVALGAGLLATGAVAGALVPRWLAASRSEASHVARLRREALARPHLDVGRTLLARFDRFLMTPDWTVPEATRLAQAATSAFDRALDADPGCGEAHLGIARAWRMGGSVERALAECDRALAADPGLATAYLERALLALERYDELQPTPDEAPRPETPEAGALRGRAAADCEAVRRWSRDVDELALADGLQAYGAGRVTEAADRLRAVAEAAVADPRAWEWAGRALQREATRLPLAIAALDRALGYRPRALRPRFLRAWCREHAGDLVGARADYDACLADVPDYRPALCNRGLLRERIGDLPGALADHTAAAAGPDGLLAGLVNRATVLEALGQTAEALAEYDRIFARDPRSVAAWNNRAHLHKTQGRFGEALTDYDRALALDPDFVLSLMHRGEIRLARGDRAGGTTDLARAIARAPQDGFPHLVLGLDAEGRGDLDAALRHFESALAAEPDYPDALVNRAKIRQNRGDFAAALPDYERALAVAPPDWHNRAGARTELARCERMLTRAAREAGRHAEAAAHAGRALDLEPDWLEGRIWRAQALAALGDDPGAMADFQRAIDADPTLPGPWAYRGAWQVEAGRPAEAAADLERALALGGPDWDSRAVAEEFLARARVAAGNR